MHKHGQTHRNDGHTTHASRLHLHPRIPGARVPLEPGVYPFCSLVNVFTANTFFLALATAQRRSRYYPAILYHSAIHHIDPRTKLVVSQHQNLHYHAISSQYPATFLPLLLYHIPVVFCRHFYNRPTTVFVLTRRHLLVLLQFLLVLPVNHILVITRNPVLSSPVTFFWGYHTTLPSVCISPPTLLELPRYLLVLPRHPTMV